MKIKLAEALLRRKELQEKVDLLRNIDRNALYEVKARRVNVTESLDEITAQVPKLTASQVTAEFDFYAKQLRKVDACIQRANWESDIELDSEVMSVYTQPAEAA